MVIENSENVKSNSNVNTSNTTDNAIYDIICYYKEENEENNDTVHAVIQNIEKRSLRNPHQLGKYENHKHHVTLRLLGCLLIIILLSSPIYGYSTIYLHHTALFDDNILLIWTPIIYSAVYLLVTPWLFSATCVSRLSYRIVILASAFTLSLAISISGLIFIYYSKTNFLPITLLLLYGMIGGKFLLK